MAFKGDTSQISLTNIFQTLQLNGQGGVITVASGKVKRKLRVISSGIRLLALGRENPDVLRAALIKQKIVTDSQFQNIISTMGQPSTLPGEFLIRRRILTREQVEKEVAKQFREMVYEILSWKKAKYEFVTGEVGDELELFDPAGLGQDLIFNTPSVLMEAARREDEWQRMRQVVPSKREIFVAVDRATFLQPKAYHSEIDDGSILDAKKLIDGEHAVESLHAESSLSRFETFRVVSMLLTNKEIRPLTPQEKKDLAEEFRKRFKPQEAVEIYRNVLMTEPGDVDSRLKLVQILEKKKERSTAALLLEQYEKLAEHYYQNNDFGTALNYLKRIQEVDHHSIFALDKLFDIQYLQKNHKEALEIARRLVDAVKTKQEHQRGTELLLKIVDLYPAETFLFHELADLFILASQADNAVSCLKSVASVYEERGDLTRLRKTYERIASLDPNEAPNLRKIVDAERRTAQPGRVGLRASKSLLWVSLAALFAAGVGYVASLEVVGRRAYASIQGDVESCVKVNDYRKARTILEEMAGLFPFTTVPALTAEEMTRLSGKERELELQRRKREERENLQFGSLLAKLESLMSRKRYLEALAVVREIDSKALGDTNRRKLTGMEAEIQKFFAAAEELLLKARELIQNGNHEEGHRQFLHLMMNYPSTPATKELRLPLLIKSIPTGARVVLNGDAAGFTPLTIYYDPLAKFQLTIEKNGFRSVAYGEEAGRAIDFTRDWSVLARLERLPAWIFDAKAPVDCTPVGLGSRVFFGARGGRVFCLDQTNGQERWAYPVPDNWDVGGGLRGFKDSICFGTFDGSFHILEAETGKPLHRLTPTTPPRPIRHAPSEPTDEGIMAVNCGGAVVVGLNVALGAVIWTYRTETDLVGGPELHRGQLLAATADGTLHLLEPPTGIVSRRIPLGGRMQVPGKAVGGTFLFADVTGKIRRVDLATGRVLWTYESPLDSITTPALGGDLVFFGSRAGIFAALDLTSGDLKWRGKVNEGILAAPIWHRNSFYLCTKGGQVVCLEAANGNPAWGFVASGPCGSSPGAAGNLVLLASDDHRVYAFEEN